MRSYRTSAISLSETVEATQQLRVLPLLHAMVSAPAESPATARNSAQTGNATAAHNPATINAHDRKDRNAKKETIEEDKKNGHAGPLHRAHAQ